MPELKPCPFCGAKPPVVRLVQVDSRYGEPPTIRVSCGQCTAGGGFGMYRMAEGQTFLSQEDMVGQMYDSARWAWNRREGEN